MRKYKIAVTWAVCGEAEVEANTLEEAIRKVEENENDEFPIAMFDGEYVDDSFEINQQCTKELNPIKYEYVDGLCPDCGQDIPKNAAEGESCSNCEHVFNYAREVD
jgi:hypothetical protein